MPTYAKSLLKNVSVVPVGPTYARAVLTGVTYGIDTIYSTLGTLFYPQAIDGLLEAISKVQLADWETISVGPSYARAVLTGVTYGINNTYSTLGRKFNPWAIYESSTIIRFYPLAQTLTFTGAQLHVNESVFFPIPTTLTFHTNYAAASSNINSYSPSAAALIFSTKQAAVTVGLVIVKLNPLAQTLAFAMAQPTVSAGSRTIVPLPGTLVFDSHYRPALSLRKNAAYKFTF